MLEENIEELQELPIVTRSRADENYSKILDKNYNDVMAFLDENYVENEFADFEAFIADFKLDDPFIFNDQPAGTNSRNDSFNASLKEILASDISPSKHGHGSKNKQALKKKPTIAKNKMAIYDKSLVKKSQEIFQNQCRDFFQLMAQNQLYEMSESEMNISSDLYNNLKFCLSENEDFNEIFAQYELFCKKIPRPAFTQSKHLSSATMDCLIAPEFQPLLGNMSILPPKSTKSVSKPRLSLNEKCLIDIGYAEFNFSCHHSLFIHYLVAPSIEPCKIKQYINNSLRQQQLQRLPNIAFIKKKKCLPDDLTLKHMLGQTKNSHIPPIWFLKHKQHIFNLKSKQVMSLRSSPITILPRASNTAQKSVTNERECPSIVSSTPEKNASSATEVLLTPCPEDFPAAPLTKRALFSSEPSKPKPSKLLEIPLAVDVATNNNRVNKTPILNSKNTAPNANQYEMSILAGMCAESLKCPDDPHYESNLKEICKIIDSKDLSSNEQVDSTLECIFSRFPSILRCTMDSGYYLSHATWKQSDPTIMRNNFIHQKVLNIIRRVSALFEGKPNIERQVLKWFSEFDYEQPQQFNLLLQKIKTKLRKNQSLVSELNSCFNHDSEISSSMLDINHAAHVYLLSESDDEDADNDDCENNMVESNENNMQSVIDPDIYFQHYYL